MNPFFIDPECLANYFDKVIPEQKMKTLEAELVVDLDKAIFLADLYKTPTSELESLKQKVESEWKELPFYLKIFAKMMPESILIDRRKEVTKEVIYRQNNERTSEDCKKPIIKLADIYKNRGLEQISNLILQRILPAYQQTTFS
ncbi:MAG: hypothetical protein V1866_01690 [archaeon]